jgi:hypothetical protein
MRNPWCVGWNNLRSNHIPHSSHQEGRALSHACDQNMEWPTKPRRTELPPACDGRMENELQWGNCDRRLEACRAEILLIFNIFRWLIPKSEKWTNKNERQCLIGDSANWVKALYSLKDCKYDDHVVKAWYSSAHGCTCIGFNLAPVVFSLVFISQWLVLDSIFQSRMFLNSCSNQSYSSLAADHGSHLFFWNVILCHSTIENHSHSNKSHSVICQIGSIHFGRLSRYCHVSLRVDE